ncbi:MAG TPA: SAP domain-containing protein [Pyrinomonadaceae bacterium]|jgi:hypothetical protein
MLRDFLRAHGLAVSGTKAALRERLMQALASGKVSPLELFDFEGSRLAPTQESTTMSGPSAIVRFSFERMPAGQYVLSFGNVNAAGNFETIFYPGTRDAESALVINVTPGKHEEVFMKIP